MPLRLVTLVLFVLSSCGAIDSALDCRAICSRYSSCFDAKYDVGACETRCRTSAGNDPDYRRKADQCSACIDERACTSATFNCAAQCSSVVP